ncbi:MAG TPA: universal stress protein [Sphingomonas sp.]|uniref:universal stress protein n=1 Tax=Sphingomonas sp. TaxID=28214 RepID=UPI002ED9F9EF
MRTYLVVIDESVEARVALRFAARRAAKTGGGIEIMAPIAPPEFVQWGAVQSAMEEEARIRVDALIAQVAGELIEETGLRPSVTVVQGEPVACVRDRLKREPTIAALVLGAAIGPAPGVLVTHFAGAEAGMLRCPVMIVPGSLDDAAIDLLS